MQNFLSDIFYFTRKERRGIYVLLLLIILVFSINLTLQFIFAKPKTDLKKFRPIIAQYDSLVEAAKNDTLKLFNFDPNKTKMEDWLKLGINQKQAQVILNYLRKGGSFKKKEDLMKIYSINKETYLRLEPFIKISSPTQKIKRAYLQIELNSSDSLQLVKVRGIGPVFASRILKYKNLLGGYISLEQLREVYGIDSLKYEAIHKNFTNCNLDMIKRININKADFKQLLKHPYISYDFTKDIVNRRRKKVFTKAEDAFNIQFISSSDFKKLLPYLSTE